MDSLKSVLYVLPTTAIGGAETKFLNIIKLIKDVKSVVLTHVPVTGYFSAFDIKVHGFEEYGCFQPMHVSVRNIMRYSRAIADVVKKEKIDCIVGIMHTGCFYASFAKDFFRLKVHLIGTIEGPVSAFFRTEGRVPTVLEKSLLWYFLRRPSIIIVPGKGVKDDLEKNWGIPGKKIVVIYNGIDIDGIRSTAAERVDIDNCYKGKIIVTACRIDAPKDFPTLLKAFKEVRENIESRLVIVGDGILKDEVIRYARELGIEDNMIITGFQKNPFPFFKKADVFVLSSFFEGFGNVIVEAMALGVPVVATDCPSGPGEIIQHGFNGFLVPVQEHHAMAESILRVLQDAGLRNEFKARGLERAECFKSEDMIDGFRRLISEVR